MSNLELYKEKKEMHEENSKAIKMLANEMLEECSSNWNLANRKLSLNLMDSHFPFYWWFIPLGLCSKFAASTNIDHGHQKQLMRLLLTLKCLINACLKVLHRLNSEPIYKLFKLNINFDVTIVLYRWPMAIQRTHLYTIKIICICMWFVYFDLNFTKLKMISNVYLTWATSIGIEIFWIEPL